MSNPTIDLTARSRIRSLAARMYRFRIAGVFSVTGGAPVVDEAALDADQKAEAACILEEVAASSTTIADVEAAVAVTRAISRYVKPSCPTCHGNAVVRRGSADDLCVCVDRRWQSAVNHQAFVSTLRAPGRAAGVSIKSTRASELAERTAAAKESLARAKEEESVALADLDAELRALDANGAEYFTKRDRFESLAGLAGLRSKVASDAQAKVEEIALQIGRLLEPVFEQRSIDNRFHTHAAVDAFYDAAIEASRCRADLHAAEEAARQLAVLDADNKPLILDIERLRAERARIARHHQPKIDRAEKKLRRLTYLSGGGSNEAVTGDAAKETSL